MMVPRSHPAIIINSDASGVNVGKDLNKMVKVGYKGKRKDNISAGQGLKAPPREKDDADRQKNNMGYIIKPYATISAGLYLGRR